MVSGFAIRPRQRPQRKIVEIVGHVFFLLPSGLAQILAEIALLIEQAHGHQRHAQIAGRLDVIARQHAQVRPRKSTGIR